MAPPLAHGRSPHLLIDQPSLHHLEMGYPLEERRYPDEELTVVSSLEGASQIPLIPVALNASNEDDVSLSERHRERTWW